MSRTKENVKPYFLIGVGNNKAEPKKVLNPFYLTEVVNNKAESNIVKTNSEGQNAREHNEDE